MSRKSLRRSKRAGVRHHGYAEGRKSGKQQQTAYGSYGGRARRPPLPRGADGPHKKPSILLDQTKTDIFVSGKGGRRPLRKPWLLTAVDAHSRAVVGSVVIEGEPNYKAVVERLFSNLNLQLVSVPDPDGLSLRRDLPETEE